MTGSRHSQSPAPACAGDMQWLHPPGPSLLRPATGPLAGGFTHPCYLNPAHAESSG